MQKCLGYLDVVHNGTEVTSAQSAHAISLSDIQSKPQ